MSVIFTGAYCSRCIMALFALSMRVNIKTRTVAESDTFCVFLSITQML